MATLRKEMKTTSTVNEKLPKVEAAYLDNMAGRLGILSKDLNLLRRFHKPDRLARGGRTVGATGAGSANPWPRPDIAPSVEICRVAAKAAKL